jgi:uncharacterized membrane protein YbaN (DUF454 family)
MVVPGMPTTVFMILGLFCFKRGSKRFEDWLLNHKWFGPTLRNWERTGSIPRRVKWVSVSMLSFFVLLSSYLLLSKPWVVGVILAVGGFGVWYILSRPTTEDFARAGWQGTAGPIEPVGPDEAPGMGVAVTGPEPDPRALQQV